MPMNPQERDIISGVFDRLKKGADAPREPEAEKFIADQIAAQPYAPYIMTQSLYVQEQAINNMQTRIKELELQLQAAHELHPPEASAVKGGFFSSIFGGSSAPQAAPAPQQGSPWGRAPAPQQPQYAQPPQQSGPWAAPQAAAPGGGGFMASALTTAAGVAGGVLAANALSSMFSGHHGQQSSSFMGDTNQSNAGYNDGYADAQQDQSYDNTQQASHDAQLSQDSYDDAQQDIAGYDDGGGSDSYDA